jgi:hypothetical protein
VENPKKQVENHDKNSETKNIEQRISMENSIIRHSLFDIYLYYRDMADFRVSLYREHRVIRFCFASDRKAKIIFMRKIPVNSKHKPL